MANNEIKVGDKVRSYDFPHTQDCFVEGTVEGFCGREGCRRYSIRVERVVFNGEQDDDPGLIGLSVYPPVNGTPNLFGGVTKGVVKL